MDNALYVLIGNDAYILNFSARQQQEPIALISKQRNNTDGADVAMCITQHGVTAMQFDNLGYLALVADAASYAQPCR